MAAVVGSYDSGLSLIKRNFKNKAVSGCFSAYFQDLFVKMQRFSKALQGAAILSQQNPVAGIQKKIAIQEQGSRIVKEGIRKRFPSLKICDCIHASVEQRSFLQQASLEQVQQIYPDPSQPITIVSVGCGGCLGEVEFLLRLKAVGYEKVTIVLVDPSEKTAEALPDLQIVGEDQKTSIIYFKSLGDYATAVEENPQYRANLLFLVDLQSLTSKGNDYDPQGTEENLTQHSFHFLRDKGFLPENTIISFTEENTAVSGIFTNNAWALNQLADPLDWYTQIHAAQYKPLLI